MSVILMVREVITSTPQQLISSNDKRKKIIQRFASFPNYPDNITIKKIENNPTYDDLKAFYDEVKVGKANSDTLYFIDEKATSNMNPTDLYSLDGDLRTVFTTTGVQVAYLANSMDNCDIRSTETYTLTSLPDIFAYSSLAPKGMIAVCSNFSSWNNILIMMRDRIEDMATARLTALVRTKSVKAMTTSPRIFEMNISMITDPYESALTQSCRVPTDYGTVLPNHESRSLFYFILGTVIVIIGVWILSGLNKKR